MTSLTTSQSSGSIDGDSKTLIESLSQALIDQPLSTQFDGTIRRKVELLTEWIHARTAGGEFGGGEE